MTNFDTFWIAIAVIVAVVAILAIWKGGKFGMTYKGVRVNAEGRHSPERAVKVFNDTTVGPNGEVGNVIGHRNNATDAPEIIDVANRSNIEGKVGDISGVEINRPKL